MKDTTHRTLTTISLWSSWAVQSHTQSVSNRSVCLPLAWTSILVLNVLSLDGESYTNQAHSPHSCTKLKYLWLIVNIVRTHTPNTMGTLSRIVWDVPVMTKARLMPVKGIAVVLWCVRRIIHGIWWELSVGVWAVPERMLSVCMQIWLSWARGCIIPWTIINFSEHHISL